MNSKIAIVVCGNSGIDYIKHDYRIPVFRSILMIDNEEYEDYIDITAGEFYQRLENNPNINVRTSQTSTGVMRDVYFRLENEGYTDVIVIPISSQLSGTYQNALLAAELVDRLNVHVFDSRLVTYPEAKMALDAAEMARQGKSVPEILKRLEWIRDHTKVYFTVDTLKHLVKNGRLSTAAGVLGGLLKIKPILTITPLGKIESIEKIRTSNKAIERLKERFFEETQNIDFEPFVIYTNNIDIAEEIVEEIKAQYPNIKDIPLLPLTPVVGAHAGPGTIGIGYIEKE